MGVFSPDLVKYIISFSIILFANAHHWCCAVNMRSKLSRFYLYLWQYLMGWLSSQFVGIKFHWNCFIYCITQWEKLILISGCYENHCENQFCDSHQKLGLGLSALLITNRYPLLPQGMDIWRTQQISALSHTNSIPAMSKRWSAVLFFLKKIVNYQMINYMDLLFVKKFVLYKLFLECITVPLHRQL